MEERIQNAQDGKREERDKLINENMGLVYSVARRFANRGYELEDLISVGTVGLIKAVDRFDTQYQVCFSTYAVPLIMGEIRRMIRDTGSIRVSRSLKERAYRVMKEKERMILELGREPHVFEIASRLQMKEEDLVECLDAMVMPASLSEAIAGEGDDAFSLEEKLPDQKECEERWLEKMVLQDAMEQLPEREKRVITLKYYMGKTQGEIAGFINLSQAQVSRIEKNALLSMRKYLHD